MVLEIRENLVTLLSLPWQTCSVIEGTSFSCPVVKEFFFLFSEYISIQPNEGVFLDSDVSRPRRTGSLSLFMRKFYNLAFVRLEHLCHGCNITEESFKRKIWTTFETAIREHTDLFKGRHLDQNIMCSLYICWKKENHKKGVKDEKIFSKIIQQVIIYLFKSVKIFSSVDPVTIAFLTEIFFGPRNYFLLRRREL